MIYKVMVDLDNLDLNSLMQKATDKGFDLCVGYDNLYFYAKGNRKVQISNIMKKMDISEFVIKPILEKPQPTSNDFASIWCYEKMTAEEQENFEEEHQEELVQMLDNIQAIKKALLENKLKEESADGTGDNKEEGSSTESAD